MICVFLQFAIGILASWQIHHTHSQQYTHPFHCQNGIEKVFRVFRVFQMFQMFRVFWSFSGP